MEWINILSALGITAAMGTLIPFFITRYLNKKDKRTNDIKELKAYREAHEKLTNKVIATLDRLDESIEEQKIVEQDLLRHNIIQIFKEYVPKGSIPFFEKESFDKMYKQYKKRGGNGVIEGIAKKIYALPIDISESEN